MKWAGVGCPGLRYKYMKVGWCGTWEILPFSKLQIRRVPLVCSLCCRARPERSQRLEEWSCSSPCPAKLVGRGVWSVMWKLQKGMLYRMALQVRATVGSSCRKSQKSSRVGALVNPVQQLCARPHSGVRSWWENLSDLSAAKQLVVSRERVRR